VKRALKIIFARFAYAEMREIARISNPKVDKKNWLSPDNQFSLLTLNLIP
jgi:hypothetical protein